MTPEPTSTNVVARYAPRHSGGPFWLIAGVILLGLIAYRLIGQSGEERLFTIVFLALLVVGFGVAGGLVVLVSLRAVEVTAAGTMDFVSRTNRESFPRTALRRVEGKTTSSRNSRSEWATFIFTEAGPKEIEKKVLVPRKDDPALQEFVRQLEILNPRLDASQFWVWSRGAEAAR